MRSARNILHSSQPAARTNASPRVTCAASTRGIVTSIAPAARHRIPITPVLRNANLRAEPALHHLRREDVVAAAAERGPDAREEVVQMRGDEACELRLGMVGAVDDKRHEEHGPGQELCVEVYDEEVDLARGVVLSVRVGVGERQGREERVAVKQNACDSLGVVSSGPRPQNRHRQQGTVTDKVCREPTPPSEMESSQSFLK
jgi:hypothetical protein